MVSIVEQGPPAPRRAVRDAVAWGRVVVATLARGVVATLLGLALWAAAPAAIGWHPTTVMTGSMEPRLRPGDVVVSRPVPATDLRLGQVLLADDPDQPGLLRMHRAVATGPQSTVVTKGDANPGRDSTPVERSAVHGVAALRIPVVAAPIVWLRDGAWALVVLVALALVVLLWLCTIDGPLRRSVAASADDEDDEDGPGDGGNEHGGPRHASDTGPEAAPADATPASAARRSGRHVLVRRDADGPLRVRRRGVRPARRLRRGGAAAVVVIVAAGAGALLPGTAVAGPFSRSTAAVTGTMRAAVPAPPTGLKCAANGSNAVTISWDPPADQPHGYVVVGNGTPLTTAGANASSVPLTAQGALLNLGSTWKIQVQADFGSAAWNTTTTTTTSVNVRVTSLLGITSVVCA